MIHTEYSFRVSCFMQTWLLQRLIKNHWLLAGIILLAPVMCVRDCCCTRATSPPDAGKHCCDAKNKPKRSCCSQAERQKFCCSKVAAENPPCRCADSTGPERLSTRSAEEKRSGVTFVTDLILRFIERTPIESSRCPVEWTLSRSDQTHNRHQAKLSVWRN